MHTHPLVEVKKSVEYHDEELHAPIFVQRTLMKQEALDHILSVMDRVESHRVHNFELIMM